MPPKAFSKVNSASYYSTLNFLGLCFASCAFPILMTFWFPIIINAKISNKPVSMFFFQSNQKRKILVSQDLKKALTESFPNEVLGIKPLSIDVIKIKRLT